MLRGPGCRHACAGGCVVAGGGVGLAEGRGALVAGAPVGSAVLGPRTPYLAVEPPVVKVGVAANVLLDDVVLLDSLVVP